MIDAQPDMTVVGEAADGGDRGRAGARARPRRRPDGHPDARAWTGSRRPGSCWPTAPPGVRVLVLTTFDLDEYVYEAVRAGASGFLVKDIAPADLAAGVRTVAAGNALLAPSVVRRLMEDFARRPAAGRASSGRAGRPDRARARGARPDRPRAQQRRDRRGAVHQRDDGPHPRDPRPAEARPPRPGPGGGAGLRVRPGAARARREPGQAWWRSAKASGGKPVVVSPTARHR